MPHSTKNNWQHKLLSWSTSGMANLMEGVTRRCEPFSDIPTPPPMTAPCRTWTHTVSVGNNTPTRSKESELTDTTGLGYVCIMLFITYSSRKNREAYPALEGCAKARMSPPAPSNYGS